MDDQVKGHVLASECRQVYRNRIPIIVKDLVPAAQLNHRFAAHPGPEKKVDITVVHAAFALDGGFEFVSIFDGDFRELTGNKTAAGVIRARDKPGLVFLTAVLTNRIGFGNDVAFADITGFPGAFNGVAAAI